MRDNNPYAMAGAIPAAEAAVDERAAFLKKVYGILGLGLGVFAACLWAAANVPAVRDAIWNAWGAMGGAAIFVSLGLQMGGFWLVRITANTRPLNAIVFFAFTVMWAFLLAPLIMFLTMTGAADLITQGSLVTAIIFGGLTLFVMITAKDFSFMRGILVVGMLAMVAVGICSWIFGFQIGTLYFGAGVLLMSGFVLYDTSNILHHYPTNMAFSAAASLFASVVILFAYVLQLLMSLNDD